jgi:hypothetical protein
MEAKIIRERKLNKKETQITTHFNKKRNKTINVDELDDLLEKMYDKGTTKHDNFKYSLIRVMNGDKWITFKDYEDLEDYYSGKVKDDSKFYEFMQVQITCVFS